jgi:glyoxylate/hydroxypyruvate reductase
VSLLFGASTYDADEWMAALRRRLPDVEIRRWPEDPGDLGEVEYVLIQSVRRFDYASVPNVRIIFTLGAGADRILRKPELPAKVPVVRAVSAGVVQRMVQYVQYAVLHFHRGFDRFRENQAAERWESRPGAGNHERRVGVMGLGSIGEPAARALVEMGFPVAGWSRRAKTVAGVTVFSGADGLLPFLGRVDILVCLLPLTAETAGILNARTFAALPAGAYVVNAARGRHLVEPDLLAALDDGRIAGAMLDVFEGEPLAPSHPFWCHPRVVVTPHAAGWNDAGSAAEHVAWNIRRVQVGLPPHPVVDRDAGY